MADSIFVARDDGRFLPTSAAGSPWGEGLLHGGSAAGLLAYSVERSVQDPELQLARLTVDLFRPVPEQPLVATTRVARGGRRIHVVDAALVADGQEVSRASALLLRRTGNGAVERMPGVTPDGPEGLETSPLGRGARAAGVREGLHTTVEARWVQRRERDEGGPAVAWLRLPVPLVAGEENSPLVRVATVSDFVNALGSMRAPGAGRFINVDITLYLERPPEGEWIGFEVTRATEPSGLGVSRATLYDAAGQIGAVTQAVLANEMR